MIVLSCTSKEVQIINFVILFVIELLTILKNIFSRNDAFACKICLGGFSSSGPKQPKGATAQNHLLKYEYARNSYYYFNHTVLPCGHSFCFSCIIALRQKFCCLCRAHIPQTAHELPQNYALIDCILQDARGDDVGAVNFPVVYEEKIGNYVEEARSILTG